MMMQCMYIVHVASIDRISQILVGSRAIIDYQLHDNYAKKGQRSKSGGQIDSSILEILSPDPTQSFKIMIMAKC